MPRFVAIMPVVASIACGQTPLTTAQIAKRVAPSVVTVQGRTDAGDVLGSGFIVSSDGKIVTNLHVIRDLKTATVQLANGENFDSVSVLATDDRRDLAVVRIAGFKLPALELGDSSTLTVGEVVIVGSPRGLEGTVTAGILSSVRDGGNGFTVLQTDAAVNPGNSGGPMVNCKGQVIGVVSFKLRSSEGLNFAVPINYVRGLLNQLHAPMSLDEMRRSLETDHEISGASLEKTLEWLKEKLPLASRTFTPSADQKQQIQQLAAIQYMVHKTVPVRFESCVVTYEGIVMINATTRAFRQTVPLAEIESVAVYDNQVPSIIQLPGPTNWAKFISGFIKLSGGRMWLLSLVAKSKEIFYEEGMASESRDNAFLQFDDESTARRVADAFKHVASLCRGKDPF